ncbi:hypothetical protein DH2020_036753 [Rehmannia glutinosa]|uniref:YGGT family protein n=1 Tax=Rehmannia glutinosa TaxID=99300 RepID=A0ABR0V657_REHGL
MSPWITIRPNSSVRSRKPMNKAQFEVKKVITKFDSIDNNPRPKLKPQAHSHGPVRNPGKQPFSSNHNFQLLTGASNVVREVQKSVASNVDKCLKLMDSLRSKNEVLDKIISFYSNLQSGFQKLPEFIHAVQSKLCGNFTWLVLTWFPNAPPAVVSPLSTLCDPYLNIFRGIIPPLGGTLDLSPILAFLVLNAFTSTAAALPAELPLPESSKGTLSHATASHITTSQKKWMQRLAGNKSKRPNGEI